MPKVNETAKEALMALNADGLSAFAIWQDSQLTGFSAISFRNTFLCPRIM